MALFLSKIQKVSGRILRCTKDSCGGIASIALSIFSIEKQLHYTRKRRIFPPEIFYFPLRITKECIAKKISSPSLKRRNSKVITASPAKKSFENQGIEAILEMRLSVH